MLVTRGRTERPRDLEKGLKENKRKRMNKRMRGIYGRFERKIERMERKKLKVRILEIKIKEKLREDEDD